MESPRSGPIIRSHGSGIWGWQRADWPAFDAENLTVWSERLNFTPEQPTVFDGHLGLAHDALVVAASGARVVGAEIDPILAYVTECGLRGLASSSLEMREIVSRITVHTGHHLDVMMHSSDAWSAVMFSPMFISPDFESPDMVAWREIARIFLYHRKL